MTDNEKIAYAMEHYTEGCVYQNPLYMSNKKFTLSKNNNTYDIISEGNIDGGSGNGYLYYNNQWSTVIKKGIEPDWVEIAKIKYPVGCKYKCPNTGKINTLEIIRNTYSLYEYSNTLDVDGGWGLGYLRFKGVWAEIINDFEIVNDFEIGKWYTFTSFDQNNVNFAKCFNFIDGCFETKDWIIRNKFISKAAWKRSNMSNIKILTDLTEIQEYLPDGHVDKINNETYMFKKGDYIVTLKVQDNSTHFNCGRNNYCFKQKVDNEGIYPEVDLQGNSQNGHNMMSFDKKSWLKNWRYATFQEIVEYDRLGKPFDVTTLVKNYKYEVVHCTTQKQWNFVNEKLNNTFNRKTFDCSPCINIISKNYASTLAFYQRDNNTKIYTFNEWCTKMGYIFPVDKILDRIDELTNPIYVECIESYSGSYKIGKIYKVNEKGDVMSGCNPTAKWNNTNDYQSKFKPSTTDEWNAQEINKTNIDEFTKKYPIKNTMTDDIKKDDNYWINWKPGLSTEPWKPPLISIDPYEGPKNTNLIKLLYVKPKQKTEPKEKVKKVKFLNVNIIKIN